MIDLGTQLREAREAKGVSLAEAAIATRIRERFLAAIEVNDWAALPTTVQARGFLRNYAVYLGLDADQVTARYSQITRAGTVSLPVPAATESPVPTTAEDGAVFRPRDIDIGGVSQLPSWLSSDIIIGVALALVVAALGYGLLRLAFGDSNEPSASSTPETTRSTLRAATEAPLSGGESTPGSVTPTFDASMGHVQLGLEATEHVWVRVTVDGAPVLEGILAPNTPQTWQGTQYITLETANGAGLQTVVNGQPQGPLGERGQAVTVSWGPDGLLSATPTASP